MEKIAEQRSKRQERTGKIKNIQEQKQNIQEQRGNSNLVTAEEISKKKKQNIHELTEKKIEEHRSKRQERTGKIIANRKDHKYPRAKNKISKSKEAIANMKQQRPKTEIQRAKG